MITPSRRPDAFRAFVSVHMPIIVFLLAYFCTVVLGNLLFASPIARAMLIGYPQAFFDFPETFTIGYWTLLFLPFIITPPIYLVARHLLKGTTLKLASYVTSFNRAGYAIVSLVLLVFVSQTMVNSGILKLIGSGTDAIASVEVRFQILSRLGFPALIVLQSLLTFMSITGLVSAIRSGRTTWWTLATVSIVATSVGLIFLNMKWPLVLFYLSIMLTVFMYAKKWVYTGTAFCALLLVFVYLTISSYVFRFAPAEGVPPDAPGVTSQGVTASEPPPVVLPVQVANTFNKTVSIVSAALSKSPFLARAAVLRMSLGFPYYYHVFTSEGPVCGGIIEQARIGPGCRPSTIIYTRIYGADGFEGRGTAGATVHISAYSLGGWPLAIFSLLATSIVLGAFSCLPLNGNSTLAALRTTGAIAGYHFSQLPGEGVFLYDHGLLWLFLLLIVCTFGAKLSHFWLPTTRSNERA